MGVCLVHSLDRGRESPHAARTHVRDFFRDRPGSDSLPDGLVGDVELVVSELVTNAVLHGSGHIQLRLEVLDGVVSVGVLDGGRAPPSANGQPLAEGSEGGRGLALVAELSTEWGFRPAANGGKEVWAVILTTVAATAVPTNP